MDKDTILSMRDSMEDTIDTMGSSLVKAMGVAYAVSCDKAAGLDVDHIQKSYLLSAGLKMVGMAFLMGIVTVLVCFKSRCRNRYDTSRKSIQAGRWIFKCGDG